MKIYGKFTTIKIFEKIKKSACIFGDVGIY